MQSLVCVGIVEFGVAVAIGMTAVDCNHRIVDCIHSAAGRSLGCIGCSHILGCNPGCILAAHTVGSRNSLAGFVGLGSRIVGTVVGNFELQAGSYWHQVERNCPERGSLLAVSSS